MYQNVHVASLTRLFSQGADRTVDAQTGPCAFVCMEHFNAAMFIM